MKTQLSIQFRDFQEHEKKIEQKFAREMEVFKLKYSAQKSSTSPAKPVQDSSDHDELIIVLKD